jgi:hypothetical protein
VLLCVSEDREKSGGNCAARIVLMVPRLLRRCLVFTIGHSLALMSFAHNASIPPGLPVKAIHTITGDFSAARVDPGRVKGKEQELERA